MSKTTTEQGVDALAQGIARAVLDSAWLTERDEKMRREGAEIKALMTRSTWFTEAIAKARTEGATQAERLGHQHTDAALAEVERRLVNIDTPALDKATLDAAAQIVGQMRAAILAEATR